MRRGARASHGQKRRQADQGEQPGRRSPGRRSRRAASRAVILLVALLLPVVSSATAANASEIKLPFRVAVRSAAEHLWSLVTGAHAATPKTPSQETGTASADSRQVPAAVTRAVSAATGQAPGQGPGQLPAYTWHAPQAKTYLAGGQAAPGQDPFNGATSKLMPSDSTANSDMYQNADGSYTKHVYPEPVNYKNSSGSWAAINTNLAAGTGGRWQESANSTGVGFAPKANDPALSSVSFGAGLSLSYGLAGAAAVTGTASGSQVTYPGVLPATDLVEQGLDSGVSESLVLHSAQAATTWTFPLQLTGLSAQLANDGSVQLVDGSGQVQGVIPAGIATDSHFDPQVGPDGAQTPVTYQLVSYNGGTALQASIDPAWLADPDRVFPVTVDPTTVKPQTSSSTYVEYPYNNNNSGTAVRKVGTYDSGTNYDRTFLGFANLGSDLQNQHVTAAQLHVFDIWAWQCNTAEPFYAYLISQAWDPAKTTTWPGPSISDYLGQDDSVAPAAACTNTSGNPNTGGWMTMDLSTDFINGWTLGTTPDYGIALTASTTDNNAWKQFDSDYTYQIPYLSITYQADVAPQINSQYPPSNYNAPTLTPELMADGADPDSWPDAIKYKFNVYNTSGKQVAGMSTPQASPDWTVPAGSLQWGQTYYWIVQDYDGLDYNPNPQIYYFSTPVPQPLIASGLSQNTSGPGFDPSSGNYTTSVTDAQVATTGPSLSIERDYNSLNSDPTGAFGSGWSSILDMQAAPGEQDQSGNTESMVVTYPDGEQVAFGKNAGTPTTYSAPPGRFATFAPATSGVGYTLTDKNDTAYKFAQSLGSGAYGITSVTDALGRVLNFTYNSSNQVTAMTSGVSGRALHFTWSTPSGASSAHVASVTTDPVTAGDSASALTWTYAYTGDQLNTACPPSSSTACTAYTYTSGSHYQDAVLDSGPRSYWRMDETTGSIAYSSILSNEGTDNASYSGVTLSQTGPLPGSSASSAGFNGTSSYAKLPSGLVSGASYQSLSAWFKTTATGGVIFSSSADAISKSSTTNQYVPMLYIGEGGDINAEYWNGGFDPMLSTNPVNDGKWHLAVLTAAGNTESLYVDGQLQTTVPNKTISMLYPQDNDYAGTGFLGGSWPHEPNTNSTNTGYPTYFNGNMSDVALWDRPLTGAEIQSLYAAGTQQASLLTKVTRPSGTVYSQVNYDGVTSDVTSMTDNNGGNWTLAKPSVTGSSQVYASSVLGADPADYYRLSDTGTNQAVDQIIGGTATYSNVTEGVAGPFSDATADSFNGTSSNLSLPLSDQVTTAPGSIELWFKTTGSDEVLYSSDNTALGSGTVSGGYVPSLYIGSGGDLNGAFWTGSTANVITSANAVNDGKWHFAVLSASNSSEQLYIDGQPQYTQPTNGLPATLAGAQAARVYLGGGYLGGSWPHQPNSGSNASVAWFTGSIAEFASYRSQLTDAQVAQQYNASKSSTGLAPEETVKVTDPGGKTLTDAFDPMNGDRVVSQTDALGNTTRYGYDSSGFLNTVTDPDGDVTTTGHDVRGNLVSQTTCQDQAADKCSTSYYTYYPNDTSATPTADPRNDLLETESDGRSSSASDTRYQTSYTYNNLGELTAEKTPPVPGYPSGRATTTTYTNGTTLGGISNATAPAGLPYQVTTPGKAVTTTQYYSDGDVAQTTDADGLVTKYTYDGLGRVLTKTVVSDSYPNGLVTSYQYNQLGQVTQETDPAVTDRVTGAVHTAKISTTYDADGDVTGQTVADTSGGDASRSVSNTYDSHDLLATSTDAAQSATRYTYGPYGDLASETDPAGNITDYVYDADGRLLTTTLQNYTGDPSNPSPATNLVESTRAYDPAGRLASITDSMGWVTSYTYTDDGLTAAITRSDPHTGASFTQQSNSYDAAGNLTSQATNNGATTTTYQVDAADRTDAQTLDPSALDRTTTYSYSPDDDLVNQTLTGPGSTTPVSSTSYTYDPMGNKTSQSQALRGGTDPTAWWRLDQTSGTTVPDASGTGHPATATGVTWSGGAASFAGTSSQQIATNGPVLDTTGSFTISAWVNLASTASASQTFVSQDASVDSGFFLKYNSGSWQFSRPLTNTTSPAAARATATATSPTGTWTHLAGTYDASSGTMTLYVNGAQAATATDATPYAATGALAIGRSFYNGAVSDQVDGSVSDVQVYQQALPASSVSALYQAGRDGGANPANQLTTTWTLDQRGLPTSMKDPDGNTTQYSYDEAGRLAVTTSPAITTQTYGGSATTANPVTMTGYNTFGEPVESSDADGNVTTTGYDADGRADAITSPPYTPPGGSPITATSAKTYNSLGQVSSETDALNHKTSFTYDQLGDVATVTDPDSGVTHYTYDTDGDQLTGTGPTGAVTQSTYDYLGRKLTDTQVERYPTPASYTTSYQYGTNGWLSSQTSPDNVSDSYTYDAAGETATQTDGASNKTSYGYDAAGDLTSTTNPDGTSTTATYDEAGRQTGQDDLSGTGAVLRSESAVYDGDGDQVSATDYRNNTTTDTYDADGDLTQQVQPVTTSTAITTTFGYDAAGNQTRYTDGNGHQWWTTFNSWNLPQSQVEPTTAQYTTAADSTFTTGYDADGNPATETEPGGVTITDSYNTMGDLTGQTGSGADAATTARSFGYDNAGNLTSASAPGGTDTFTYNDRGLLLTASGPSGSSTFGYNGDGQTSSVSDAAGTTSYTYDTDGRLATLADPATGTTASYSYNPESQVSQISYGTGNDIRTFGYNNLHQLTADTLKSSSGATVASIGYGYDANGNLTTKTTTGFSGASSNTYTYDEANRLASWNNGTATVSYGYDGAGNRTQVGSKTYTYDARDELTSDGTNSYAYTARGTLSSETTSTGTLHFAADAFGQSITQSTAQGSQTYAYDALGRVVSDTGSGTGAASASFSYSGTGSTLASDGTWTYTWDPTGTSLAGIGVAGGSASQGTIALTDAHSDVVGDFTAAGTSLAGSTSYDPLGNVLSSSGQSGRLGYQSSWTDPATKKVDMGARWYDPSTGQFQSKDTTTVNPEGNSAAANPFAYAGDDPLGAIDPDGHALCLDSVCGSAKSVGARAAHAIAVNRKTTTRSSSTSSGGGGWLSHVTSALDTARHYTAHYFDEGRHDAASVTVHAVKPVKHFTDYVVDRGVALLKESISAIRKTLVVLSSKVNDAKKELVQKTAAVISDGEQVGSRVYKTVTKYAEEGYNKTTTAVKTAYHAAAKATTATVSYVKHHAAAIASIAVSVAVFAGCDAALGIATGGVGAVAGAAACGALAGAAGNAVSYSISAAQSHKFSWTGLGKSAVAGAVVGGLTAGLTEGASGAVSGLLSSGAADVASALSSRAADEAASTTTEAAATTADSSGRGAAEDAASRSGGQEPAESEKSESCLVGGQSFSAGTKVLTASGALVAISKLKPGDKVLATNTAIGKTQAEPVAAVLVHYDKDLYDLKVRATGGTSVIKTTRSHLFWNQTTHHWTKAGALKYGTHLRTPSGSSAAVVGGWTPKVTTGWMWDLTIRADHDFYIYTIRATILVHNVEPCDVDQLKSYARQIRLAGDDPQAINDRVVAVGQDEAGNLTAGSSNSFDRGQRLMADELQIRRVPSRAGYHAEEDLIADNEGSLWPLRRVASDNQAPCGPERNDCAGQLDRLGIEHN
jgi:large repetitive protein